jgi:hypothetical protein
MMITIQAVSSISSRRKAIESSKERGAQLPSQKRKENRREHSLKEIAPPLHYRMGKLIEPPFRPSLAEGHRAGEPEKEIGRRTGV